MTGEPSTIAKAGRLLMLDTGEYSDYSVIGFFVVLVDFNPYEKLEIFLSEHPDQRDDCSFKLDSFLGFMLKSGLLLEINYDNMFLGSYGSCSDIRFTPGSLR